MAMAKTAKPVAPTTNIRNVTVMRKYQSDAERQLAVSIKQKEEQSM